MTLFFLPCNITAQSARKDHLMDTKATAAETCSDFRNSFFYGSRAGVNATFPHASLAALALLDSAQQAGTVESLP